MTLRRAGARWRVLVHDWAGCEPGHREGMYGISHDISPTPGESDSEWERRHVLPDTELDEVVISSWLHLEQMDVGRWWLNIAGVTLWIDVTRDGKPTKVSVYGPGDYDEPREGCTYAWTWAEEGAA